MSKQEKVFKPCEKVFKFLDGHHTKRIVNLGKSLPNIKHRGEGSTHTGLVFFYGVEGGKDNDFMITLRIHYKEFDSNKDAPLIFTAELNACRDADDDSDNERLYMSARHSDYRLALKGALKHCMYLREASNGWQRQ